MISRGAETGSFRQKKVKDSAPRFDVENRHKMYVKMRAPVCAKHVPA